MSIGTSAAYAEPDTQGFEIGRALGESFRIFARNFFKILLIGTLPAVLQLPSITTFGVNWTTMLWQTYNPIVGVAAATALILLLFVVIYIGFGIITAGAVQSLATGRFETGRAIALGFGRIGPLIGVAILSTLLFMLGFALLIIPGIIIFLRYFVAASATVLESRGPLDSLARSAELTKGRRWALLGVAVIGFGLVYGLGILGGVVMVLTLGPDSLAFEVATVLITSALNGIWPVLMGVAYYRLRMEKDGPEIDHLTKIFA